MSAVEVNGVEACSEPDCASSVSGCMLNIEGPGPCESGAVSGLCGYAVVDVRSCMNPLNTSAVGDAVGFH